MAAEKSKSGFQRLQDIEQNVIEAVDMAAAAFEELANLGPQLDQAKVQSLCELVIAKIQAAQTLTQEGVEHPVADREFKATVYNAMTRAHNAYEKVRCISMQLTSMLKTAEQGLAQAGHAPQAVGEFPVKDEDGMEMQWS